MTAISRCILVYLIFNVSFAYCDDFSKQVVKSHPLTKSLFMIEGAVIIATNEVRDRLSTVQKLWGEDHPAFPIAALPTITYEDSIILHLNGNDIRVLHLKSGHTDGDSVAIQSRIFDDGSLACFGL